MPGPCAPTVDGMASYRVVTERWEVLGAPFDAPDDRTAFALLPAHLEVPPPASAALVGLQVQVGAGWLDVGLWSRTSPEDDAAPATR